MEVHNASFHRNRHSCNRRHANIGRIDKQPSRVALSEILTDIVRQMNQLPGIDQERMDGWLERNIEELAAPVEYRLITGGLSNLTYKLTDARGNGWALRRPPVGPVAPLAHDMGREHRIIAALQGSCVPVPGARAYCEDTAICGAPFHLMTFVEGLVIKSEEDVQASFDEGGRAVVSRSFIDALADLHSVEPAAVGLESLGRPNGYVGRQLTRWHRQLERTRCREVLDIDHARALLQERIPPQQRTAIVHGDFRLDNCVFGTDGTVRAVLDWELCSLGDPLADLGLLMVYWIESGEIAPFMPNGTPTVAPGFMGRTDMVKRYAERSGLDVSMLPFYTALGYWKLACILEGMFARRASDPSPSNELFSPDACGEQALALASTASWLAGELW
jgi:aminoglycoside phosphotransferase (APT) family kinase protein